MSGELVRMEPAESALFRSLSGRAGGRHNVFEITGGMPALRSLFPGGVASPLCFALFSCSTMAGPQVTIETLPAIWEAQQPNDEPPMLPVLVVQPALACLRLGAVPAEPGDLRFLRSVRESSMAAMQQLGAPR